MNQEGSQGSGVGIQNPKSKIQNPESRIQNPESRIQNPESRMVGLIVFHHQYKKKMNHPVVNLFIRNNPQLR